MVIAIAGTSVIDAPAVTVSSLNDGQPAKAAGMQPGDTILSIAGTPVKTDDDIRSLSAQHAGKATAFEVLRAGKKETITVTPNPSPPSLGVYLGSYITPAKIEQVRAGDAADKAGFKSGDIVVSVDGKAVTHVSEFLNRLEESNGKVPVVVNRNGTETTLTFTAATGAAARTAFERSVFIPHKMVYQTPWEALGSGLKQTWTVVSLIPQGIGQAIEGKAQGPGVTSIVGIGQITGEVAQDSGFTGLLNLTALLGISLFMINLLPLPALDGGRILFIVIELLRGGRRIAPEKEGLVHFAGMVVLLALMLLITIFDVGRLFGGERLISP